MTLAAIAGAPMPVYKTGDNVRDWQDPKAGQRDLHRLFIIGASAVVRWSSMNGAEAGSCSSAFWQQSRAG